MSTDYVLVEHGLAALDLNVHALHEFLNQSECRDKMFKTLSLSVEGIIMFMSQYYPAYFQKRPGLLSRMSHFVSTSSLARKYLRVGSFIPFIRLAVLVSKKEKNGWLKVYALGRLIGLAGYFFFDNIVWAIKLRILEGWNHKTFQKFAMRFMFMNVLSSSIMYLHQWQDVYVDRKIVIYELEKLEKFGYSSSPQITRKTLLDQLSQLQRKQNDIWGQLLKSFIVEFTLAANGVFNLRLRQGILTFMDLVDVVISTRQAFRHLRMKLETDNVKHAVTRKRIASFKDLKSRSQAPKSVPNWSDMLKD